MKEHGMPEPNQVAPPRLLSLAEFTPLVERYQRELYQFLLGLVAQPEQARDLLQDTFYDAWRAAKRGAAPLVVGGAQEEIRRWLFHAAHCRAISALRRRRLIRWESLDERIAIDDEALGSLSSFEDQVAEHAALHAALSDLAPKDASCLLLMVVRGFTAADAAGILGDSPQAISKRLSRAKRRLLDAYLAHEAASEERLLR
jgi:RNA polymerase sigma-70 factor (ECF subfamily)